MIRKILTYGVIILLVSFYSTQTFAKDKNNEGWKYLKWGMSVNTVMKLLKSNNDNPIYDYTSWAEQLTVDYNKRYGIFSIIELGQTIGNLGILDRLQLEDSRYLYFLNRKLIGVEIFTLNADGKQIHKRLKRNYTSGKIKRYGKVKVFVAESKESYVFTDKYNIFFFDKNKRISLINELEKIKLAKKEKEEEKLF